MRENNPFGRFLMKAIVITAATAAKPSPAPSMAVSAMALIGLTAALLPSGV